MPLHTSQHTLQQPQQSQQLPPSDLPPISLSQNLPSLTSRDHDPSQPYIDHSSVFAAQIDPTHYQSDITRPTSSHDGVPPFPHHPHQM